MHRDYDEAAQQWLESWHEETNDTVHSQAVRELENYYDELQTFEWTPVPAAQVAFYSIEKDCDLDCSEDCLSLRALFDSVHESGHTKSLGEMLDTCNTERCNCYYSDLKQDPCNNDCKRACVLVPGTVADIKDCLLNSCMCADETTVTPANGLMALSRRENSHGRSSSRHGSRNSHNQEDDEEESDSRDNEENSENNSHGSRGGHGQKSHPSSSRNEDSEEPVIPVTPVEPQTNTTTTDPTPAQNQTSTDSQTQ